MNNWIRAVLWLALAAGSVSLHAETRHIHLLKIFDDANADYVIREGCRSIGYGIDQEVEMMKERLGILNVIEYNLSGSNFSRERLDQVLEYEMEYVERDIVIIVYVGHGFRPPQATGRLPHLYFHGYDDALDFAEVQERILEMSPSVLMSIVVACNVTQTDPSAPPPFLGDNSEPVASLTPKAIRPPEPYLQMFADQDGLTKCIDLISADQEYFTFLSRDGGIFFSEILYTFQEVFTERTYSDWSAVCLDIATRTRERSQQRGLDQLPLCNYYVRMSPVNVTVPAQVERTAAYCKQMVRELRRQQRQELKNLRRTHRTQMRLARQARMAAHDRRLLAGNQRVELENWKLRHLKEYQRQWQQCAGG